MTSEGVEPDPISLPERAARLRLVLRVIATTLLAIVVGELFSLPLLLLGALITGNSDRMEQWIFDRGSPVALGLAGVGMQTSLALWATIGNRARGVSFRSLFTPPRSWLDVLLSVVAMYGLSNALSAVIDLGQFGQDGSLAKLRSIVASLALPVQIALLPVLAFGAGFAEELFFRGHLLGLLRTRFDDRAAIFVSAILFGVVHVDPVHAVAACLLGMLLGWMMIRAGTLWVVVPAHITNNLLSTVLATPEVEPRGVLVAQLVVSLVAAAAAITVFARRVGAVSGVSGTSGTTPAPP